MPVRNYMIRYFLVAIAGALLVWSSCKKTEQPDIDYTIAGIKDVSLDENGSETVPLNIKLLSAKGEQVTLSLEGLPDGVSSSFNLTTGEPPFNSNLYIKDDSSQGGSYAVQLKAHSASGIDKDFTFKINTLAKTCGKKLAGIYTGTNICRDGNGEGFNTIEFWQDGKDPYQLNFTWNKTLLHLTVNCNTNQITIPIQTFEDRKIIGSGYADQNYSVIDMDFTQYFKTGDTVSCSGHYIKKK